MVSPSRRKKRGDDRRVQAVRLSKASQMDFIRILRSLEEFLYEVMTWLVFYPRTFLRSALHPIATLDYSRAELRKPEDEQFLDALSAPLFLMLTLLISHAIELGVHLHPLLGTSGLPGRLGASDQNLVIVRSLMFAVFPLMFAVEQVKNAGATLTKKTLRGPFFGECYPASVFSLLTGIGGTIIQAWPARTAIGWSLMAVAALWYITVQTVWLRRFNKSWARAVLTTLACFSKATAVVIVVALGIVLAK
jgi:hypothetical protein